MNIDKKMENYKLYRQILLVAAGVGLILFIIGLFTTPILAIIGFLVIGGSSFLLYWVWVSAKDWKECYEVYLAVKKKNLEGISDIAKEIKKPLANTRTIIEECFRRGLFDEYVRVGERVVLSKQYKKEVHNKNNPDVAVKCPSCGASFQAEQGEVATCPYCNTKINA